jgi:hypothetical protein
VQEQAATSGLEVMFPADDAIPRDVTEQPMTTKPLPDHLAIECQTPFDAISVCRAIGRGSSLPGGTVSPVRVMTLVLSLVGSHQAARLCDGELLPPRA